MASKRNLYRPAQVQENVGQRKNRKTLAQGRLITNSGSTQSGIAGNSSQNVSGVSNTSVNVSRVHQTSLVQGQLEDSLFSPRRAVPKVSEPRSPYEGGPAGSLDLSDSEIEDQSPGERAKFQKPDEVLCVDASRQTVNPDVSEVDIRIGVDKSPVKVICHSPSRVTQALRQQEAAENVPVNSIKSVNISSSNGYSKVRAPIIIKEKVADDHIDPRTAVQSIPMSPTPDQRVVLQSLPTNLPQPNFDDTGDSDMFLPTLEKAGEKDGGTDSDVSSVKDYLVTNHKKVKVKQTKTTKDRMLSSAKKDPQKRPDTGKKKKGRVIPSRYMQMVESKAKASLSARMDKSSIDKSNKISKSMDAPSSAKKASRKTHRSEDLHSKLDAGSQERPHTPENQSLTSTGGKTSTPTMDGSIFTHDMDIDASAIHPEASILSDISRNTRSSGQKSKTRSRVRQDLKDELMGQSILSNASIVNQSTVFSRPKPTVKLDPKSLQQTLDLMWMYDLQWAFLEAKARRSLHDQEKHAMAQIYGLYEEVERLRKAKAEKELHYTRLKHSNMADHMAEVQRQCLGPVTNSLPGLQQQYRTLAEALDTTRHQIPTRDIFLPDNEDQLQAKLEAQLLESERLLGEISVTTRQETPNISEMANAMVAMEKAVDSMENELKRCTELLAATESLTMSECALRVQEIQLLDQS